MTGRPHASLVDAMVADPDQVAVVAQQIEAEREAAEARARVEARQARAAAQQA